MREKVVEDICEFLDLSREDCQRCLDIDLFEAGLVDSFKFMQLLLYLEERFRVSFEGIELYSHRVRSIRGLAEEVLKLREGDA